MGKDPAFLFYPGDWLGGTMGMSFEEKGAYFELLIFQFNNGKFTEAQAKQVLSICSASVFQKVIQKFFKTGLYYENLRLSEEIVKRKNFSESRRNNAKSKKITTKPQKAYAQHMENGDVNGNVIEDKLNSAEKNFFNPDVNGEDIFFPVDTETVRNAWAKWKEYRFKQHGKKYPMFGEQSAIKQIEGMTEEQILNTIFKAIESNWLNLYPDRNGNGKQTKRGFDVDGAKNSIADYIAKHG